MPNELRPCTYLSMGKRFPALFHGWISFRGVKHGIKEGDCVALVELPTGSMTFLRPDDIFFSDTIKQVEKLQSRMDWDITNRTNIHAFWKTDEDDTFHPQRRDKAKYCSRCKTRAFFSFQKRKYILSDICIHCGAIMDMKEKEND